MNRFTMKVVQCFLTAYVHDLQMFASSKLRIIETFFIENQSIAVKIDYYDIRK